MALAESMAEVTDRRTSESWKVSLDELFEKFN